MIYTVTVNPSWDYLIRLPDGLRPGEINRCMDEQLFVGGKGINVSRILQALGVRCINWGFTAGFTGRAIEETLTATGIYTAFIHLTEGQNRINVKLRGDVETEINAGGPPIPPESIQTLQKQAEALQEGDFLVLAGNIPPHVPDNLYAQLADTCRRQRAQVIVDAAGALLMNTLPSQPFLIKPNRQELGALFDMDVYAARKLTDRQLLDLARQLQQKGAQNVLVSLGGDGALLAAADGRAYRTQAISGTVINSVGAGDSMTAGFLAGYLQTGSFADALRLGGACGSATAFHADLADQPAIMDCLQRAPAVLRIC